MSIAPAIDGATPLDVLDGILARSDAELVADALPLADTLLGIGETALEGWVASRGQEPTDGEAEGFRLLALHRQGARGEPSFNACRETCRELVYHVNCVRAGTPGDPGLARLVRLGAMVARHLVLFIDGKLEVAGLGDFCCSSKPLRLHESAAVPS